jgi:HrpA-like RNA helicase
MNVALPVSAHKEEILKALEEHPVIIIEGDTGSGKTTQVPQIILDETNYQCIVTQPRRLATKSVSHRVAEEMEVELGTVVGFRTAVDRKDSRDTRCLFCTDGLQLVRELTRARNTTSNGIVLIIDEVHEWNLNIETLVAWVKQLLGHAEFKVILMSATMDSQKLSDYFDGAPIIKVPGKMFPVMGSPKHESGLRQVPAKNLVDEIRAAVLGNHNTLVFLPGKPEITKCKDELKQAGIQAEILELHADLTPAEQDDVFCTYGLPKVILSTNIAQTSITIPDITYVVDTGLEKRIELRNNVETLTLGSISKSDVVQRAGRAGRVAEGNYVLCNDKSYESFVEYAVAEISRVRLDQMVLRIAGAGLDATELQFYHQPDHDQLVEAKKTLLALGALDQNGRITPVGITINKFPTSVKTAKMILEAVKRKCLSPIITIAAILETNYGSIKRNPKKDDPFKFRSWRELLGDKDYQSDLLAELELYDKAKEIGYNFLEQKGISQKSYGKACEIRKQLKDVTESLNYRDYNTLNQNAGDEISIIKCVLAGMLDHLYNGSYGSYQNGTPEVRQINRVSVLEGKYPYSEWIIGTPKNISFENQKGYQVNIYLVTNCTAVKFEWVREIAPHLIQEQVTEPKWDNFWGKLTSRKTITVNGKQVMDREGVADWSEVNLGVFISAITTMSPTFNGWFYTFYKEQIHLLNSRRDRTLPVDTAEKVFGDKLKDVLTRHKILDLTELQNNWEHIKPELEMA